MEPSIARRSTAIDRIQDSLGEVWRRVLPHRVPLYKLALVLFVLSTLIDTGSEDRKGPLGLTVAIVMLILVTAIGLLLWRAPQDRVLVGCAVVIGLWVWAQVLSGQSIRSAIIIMSVLVFSMVVAGVRPSHSLFWYQIGAAFVGPMLAALAFYLGFWHTLWTGRQTFLEHNPNVLASYLAIGFTLGLSLVFHVKKPFRKPMLLATLLLLPPIWSTGSRSGFVLALGMSVLFLGMRARRTGLAIFALGGISLAGALFVYASESIVPVSLADVAIVRRFSATEFATGEHLRIALILSGLDAFSRRPWLGHGMDAPLSPQWRISNLQYDNPDDAGAGTHNGYVDYLLMGGIPLCAVYLMLFFRAGRRLWRACRKAGEHMKDIAALAFCLYLFCLAAILVGATFGKVTWWLFGCALQALSVLALGVREETTSMTDGFEPEGVPSR